MKNTRPSLEEIRVQQKLLRYIEKTEKELSKKYVEIERLELKREELYKKYNNNIICNINDIVE